LATASATPRRCPGAIPIFIAAGNGVRVLLVPDVLMPSEGTPFAIATSVHAEGVD
jgi:hypothetical protein